MSELRLFIPIGKVKRNGRTWTTDRVLPRSSGPAFTLVRIRGMEVRKFKFANYDEAMKELLPLLRGRVFHTTTAAAYTSILSDGFIGSNKDGKYPAAYPQSENSFFRKRGCVSMVDLRTATDKQLELGDMQYRFLSPSSSREAFLLFLKPSCHDSLIPEGPADGDYSTFVEHVEAGYPDFIPISCIEEAWEITFEKPDRTLIDELDDIIAGRKPASK